MAFDVYVGTMTRFYRRDWENVAQRTAREQGIKYTIIHAGGEPEAPPPADDIREAVASWRDALSGGLEAHGCGPVTWGESDDQPYFTDRPTWDGYSAMLITKRRLEPRAAAKPSLFGRLLHHKPKLSDPERPRLAEMAEFGLQIFRDLAAKACEHRLPILLHF